MSKIKIIILFSIIFLINSEEQEYQYEQAYYSNSTNERSQDHHFKEDLKEYLIEKKLFDSEEPISRQEMRVIFLEIITRGEDEEDIEFFAQPLQELADYFVDSYYVNKKIVKGKEIYDLMDYKEISNKFQLMVKANPQYQIDNSTEEETQDDKRDEVGDPTTDI